MTLLRINRLLSVSHVWRCSQKMIEKFDARKRSTQYLAQGLIGAVFIVAIGVTLWYTGTFMVHEEGVNFSRAGSAVIVMIFVVGNITLSVQALPGQVCLSLC